MTAAELVAAFALGRGALGLNLKGIDDELALRSPGGGANSVNWMAGHILGYRDLALRQIGAEPVWDDATRRPYSGEDDAGWDAAHAVPLSEIVAALDTSQQRLAAAIGALSDADLERVIGKRTLAQYLAFLHFHEATHVGQVGLARRLLGLPGVIRPPGSRGKTQ
ncbi:MAG: DinB family protein [Longimicrobiales bacterium]